MLCLVANILVTVLALKGEKGASCCDNSSVTRISREVSAVYWKILSKKNHLQQVGSTLHILPLYMYLLPVPLGQD